MNFETTIGLEVHVELKTNQKCLVLHQLPMVQNLIVNTNVIDFGFPGTLPTVNKEGYRLRCYGCFSIEC
jgi:Asp-tRNAAsn/Glu-tRNAGln amidotransferase B subunit (PET112 homolog)